jgi:ubiquinone/menaquinone biosynthesis C-methylase UbiE
MGRNESSITRSYEAITPRFHWASKLFESKARSRSLALSKLQNGSNVLVISPPTDFFLQTILDANPDGQSHLLCFSQRLIERARREQQELRIGPAFRLDLGAVSALPYESQHFDTLFAYCYLDFLDDDEAKVAATELHRVLKEGGRLVTTYLEAPRTAVQRVTVALLTSHRLVFGGVRAVDADSALHAAQFSNVSTYHCPQKGLPIGLAHAIA